MVGQIFNQPHANVKNVDKKCEIEKVLMCQRPWLKKNAVAASWHKPVVVQCRRFCLLYHDGRAFEFQKLQPPSPTHVVPGRNDANMDVGRHYGVHGLLCIKLWCKCSKEGARKT